MRTLHELRTHLRSLEIAIVVLDDDRVEVRGNLANLTDGLRAELRSHKAELIAKRPAPYCLCTSMTCCWSHRPGAQPVQLRPLPPDTDDEHDQRVDRVLGELRKAQSWLATADRRLGPDMWADVELAGKITTVLVEWQVKETWLRGFGYAGCIHKPDRCPADSVECCLACRPQSSQSPPVTRRAAHGPQEAA